MRTLMRPGAGACLRASYQQGMRSHGFDLFADVVHMDMAGFHRPSCKERRSRMIRKRQSIAPSMVASTQTSVSPPVMMTVSIPALAQVAPRPGGVDVLV